MNLHPIQTITAGVAPTTLAGPPASASPEEGGAGTLVPAPCSIMLGGDMGAEIAALAVQQGQTQQNIDTQAAEAQDTVESQADAAQVATLHDEASTMRQGAVEGGALQMGAGACSIGSGFASVGAKTASFQAGAAAALKGGSEGLMGGGTMASGLSQAAATDSQALATGQKALADSADRAGQACRDGQKSASAFVQAALDFYREYETTKAQAQAAAVHGA